MTTPKPAPSKPLTFTPPVYLKGETKSSELPAVEGAESNVMSKKAPKNKKPFHRRADGFREANKQLAKTGLPEAKVTGKQQGLRPNISIIDEMMDVFEESKKDVEKPKKPFVLDPHLTQRPFHDDRLMQLKDTLQRPSLKNR